MYAGQEERKSDGDTIQVVLKQLRNAYENSAFYRTEIYGLRAFTGGYQVAGGY